MLEIRPKIKPVLDPGFLPASLWNAAYRCLVAKEPDSRPLAVALLRPGGECGIHHDRLLPDTPRFAAANWLYAERLVKFLLWSRGGNRLLLSNAPEIADRLRREYGPTGARRFDRDFFGGTCFDGDFAVEECASNRLPEEKNGLLSVGRNLDGCRIGFDLGGSDRKCASLIDGEVVHSEEVKWDPYFQADPAYHIDGIRDSLARAAKHLPRVDAIGGSAAGIYIDNEARVGSLFRGLDKDLFDQRIRPVFKDLRKEWGGIPFEVANDGDVTALAGSMAIGEGSVFGLSMGTSEAVGYINEGGHITGMLNELAFAPVDFRPDAPADEWSGDHGVGARYFSQQAVVRLLPASGIEVSGDASAPECLETVQERMRAGDERAAQIYRTIGTYFGYSIAHYADYYDISHLLVLGRVTSGEGGDLITETARQVLRAEFPALADAIRFQSPDESTKRHGQAVAAASLPALAT